MANQEQWVNLLTPGLRTIFELQVEALAAVAKAPLLFNVQSSSKAEEHDLGVGGFADWQEYKGAYKTTFTPKEFARGFTVERKLVHDDLYNVINKKPKGLATAAMRKREKDAADVFNFAFTASAAYYGADNQSLCDGAHPHSPSRTSSTQSNSGTTAISRDSIIATRKLMRSFTDDRGELIQVMPDTLLVPPELEDKAYVEARTPHKTTSGDNDLSFVNSLGLKVIVWDYLTDSNNWFMIDSGMVKQHLEWFDLEALTFALNPVSDFQLKAQYRGYMRYSLGWNDWKWVYGHSVT
ncbi:MAG: Mu-like prophage major head subunit gpT family protein [Deltaproteobacteria bacterium]|nr:Mu-like prophage major head subunit gpT family protein [Deltaproteobacteria bacterium]